MLLHLKKVSKKDLKSTKQKKGKKKTTTVRKQEADDKGSQRVQDGA